MREMVTIYVPDGYESAEDFLHSCRYERAPADELRIRGLILCATYVGVVCLLSAVVWLVRVVA